MKTNTPDNDTEHGYEELLADMQLAARNVFTTDASNLFDLYLENIPAEHRQHYNCHACKRFIETYGGLVTIDPEGRILPAVRFSTVPGFFIPAVFAMIKAVENATVTGVFYSSKEVWGTPESGGFHHFSVKSPNVFTHSLKSASQMMAEKKEDFNILYRSLNEFSLDTIEQAITLLKTDALYRAEKCLGVAEWFKELKEKFTSTRNHRFKLNVIWSAVASAPPGWCHIRNTMIGTLLEDLQAGMGFETVSSRFAEKMHPLQYQRPQAAPSAGNIAQAEKLVEKLGIAASLRRRFARLEEIQALWKPVEKPVAGTGVFSHLIPKGKEETKSLTLPSVNMTWSKFESTVLPTADRVEFWVPTGKTNFTALVTAVDPDAPPILQWDSLEQRNPVSWYLYSGGSSAIQWNITAKLWWKVTAICLKPSMWGDKPLEHQGKGVVFLLQGAKDSYYERSGSAIFPETLKNELREVRATIEAYSKHAVLEGYGEATACGVSLHAGSNWDALFRVTTGNVQAVYKLDRWD